MKRRRIRSLKGPIALFVVGLALVVALLALWNVVLAVDYARIRELAARATAEGGGAFHWTFIAIGSGLFAATIAVFSVLGAQLISEVRYNQRLSSFIAMFTHELNSPLAAIRCSAQTLRQNPAIPQEERDRFLDGIVSEAERLHGRIANVLRAAQLESPLGLRLAPEVVDLRAFLEDYVAARRAASAACAPGSPGRTSIASARAARTACAACSKSATA